MKYTKELIEDGVKNGRYRLNGIKPFSVKKEMTRSYLATYPIMKVSFDFDGCINDNIKIQKYAKQLIKQGIEVWIVTTRWDRTSQFFDKQYYNIHGNNSWEEVHQLALKIGIPIKQIKFNNDQWKGIYFDICNDFIWHLDDNVDEIKYNISTVPIIICIKSNWKQECNKLLNFT